MYRNSADTVSDFTNVALSDQSGLSVESDGSATVVVTQGDNCSENLESQDESRSTTGSMHA